MKLDIYENKLRALKIKNAEQVRKLQHEYAMSNSTVKIGDIVTDHVGDVRVERILWTVSSSTSLPSCVYRGEELTKAGKPFKKKSIRDAYQTNLKGD